MFMKETKPQFRFQCHAGPVLWLCFILGSCLFLSLANWQLQKGLAKKSETLQQLDVKRHSFFTLDQAYDQWKQEPTSINDLKIELTGKLLSSPFILHDNRIYQGTAGYGVYAPFRLDTPLHGATTMLINLGWAMVPGYDRQAIPQLELMQEITQISVLLEHIYPDVFTLESMTETLQDQPPILRIQKIEFSSLEKELNTSLIPFVGRSTTQTTKEKLPLMTSPLQERGISVEKHFGYSAQWLIFWFISIGIFLYTQCTWYDKLQK